MERRCIIVGRVSPCSCQSSWNSDLVVLWLERSRDAWSVFVGRPQDFPLTSPGLSSLVSVVAFRDK